MTYRIEIIPSAHRDFAALPGRDRKRLDARILSLADEPRPTGSKALAGQDSLYRLRVGDYRIIYKVRDEDFLILVVKIGHRKDVYRGIGA